MTDRALRPLFPKGFRNDVQIVITVLSADQENDPDVLGDDRRLRRADASRDIPFDGPCQRCASAASTANSSSTRPSPSSEESDLDLDRQLRPATRSSWSRPARNERARGRHPRRPIDFAHEATRRSSTSRTRWSAELAQAEDELQAPKTIDAAAHRSCRRIPRGPRRRSPGLASARSAPRAAANVMDDADRALRRRIRDGPARDALEAVVKKTVRERILKKASAPTAATSTSCGRSPATSASCRARTAPASSSAARRRC